MADSIHWTCPFCNRDATIQDENLCSGDVGLTVQGTQGFRIAGVYFTVCPNKICGRFTLEVSLFEAKPNDYTGKLQIINAAKRIRWALIPESRARSFPAYIPEAILTDYNEACLILNKSPKASATLSRRCMQGILRDFWKVKAGRLVDEIEQVRDRIDPLTWDAIDAVRSVGNIGAHMEKDIDLIVDVEPNEAGLLIELIETLLRDWYVATEEKRKRLQAIRSVAEVKKAEQKMPKASPNS